ncbi:MAG: hypothetical protein H7308_08060 [Chthonomonadaceae bacterium]|nr:hypothetical protein [Chthonomonadaceae bacterium]
MTGEIKAFLTVRSEDTVCVGVIKSCDFIVDDAPVRNGGGTWGDALPVGIGRKVAKFKGGIQ